MEKGLLKVMEDRTGQGLKGRDFISIHDFSPDEISKVFEVTRILKKMQKEGAKHPILAGKTLGMIFTKASTRTRVSFEVGIWQLGGYGLFLSAQDLQLRRGETIGDTAQVLSRYVDGIMIRTFDHSDVLDLAKYASIPVINGLTDYLHPCQALADYYTILEKKGSLKGLKVVFVGDGNNVAHSLMFGAAKLGMHIVVACPPGYEPEETVVKLAREDARLAGGSVQVDNDPSRAVSDADVIYTDVWASMGQESEREKRMRDFQSFQVNGALLGRAKPDVLVMHCLPAHRGEEITDEVMDGPHSIVFDEAENRLHCQKAIMALLMRD